MQRAVTCTCCNVYVLSVTNGFYPYVNQNYCETLKDMLLKSFNYTNPFLSHAAALKQVYVCRSKWLNLFLFHHSFEIFYVCENIINVVVNDDVVAVFDVVNKYDT